MNEFSRCRRDCFLSIKAYQNVRASLLAFEKLCSALHTNDNFLLSSFFYMGVVRYAKPFLNNRSESGNITYPIKQLKKNSSFSLEMHEHILELRNTLIAHDDFEQIEPRILTAGLQPSQIDFLIPTTIWMSNKCISYPSDLKGSIKLKEHVAVTLSSIQQKLTEDITRFRKVLIDFPEQAKKAKKYEQHLSKTNIPVSGATFISPGYTNEKWLDTPEPTFAEIHNGYHYESIQMKQDFTGPETIQLPNGMTVIITPNTQQSNH